jgi:hypothetical protein
MALRLDPYSECTGCHLPLAENIYGTACSHPMHAHCLAETNQNMPECATCRTFMDGRGFFILKINDKYQGEDRCPTCFESMKQTAGRLNEGIILAQGGKPFHQECYKGPEDDIETRIAARTIVKAPEFKTWKQGEKQRLEPNQTDEEAYARQVQAQINGAGQVHQPYAGGPAPMNLPDDPFFLTLSAAVLVLSFFAFTLNSSVHFSNPLFHLASIPFYLVVIAGVCHSIYETCIQN